VCVHDAVPSALDTTEKKIEEMINDGSNTNGQLGSRKISAKALQYLAFHYSGNNTRSALC
jgi:hypothetical protein